jgi:hypothetical protein
MSRITKLRRACHRAAAPGLLAALSLGGCVCGGVAGPVTPASPASPIPMTAGTPADAPLPEGAALSYPGFDGGGFSASLPVHAQPGDLTPDQALAQIAPILRAAGFGRSLSELAPGEPLQLPAPDLADLAREVCREEAIQEDGPSMAVCAALIGGGPPSAAAEASIQGAYGTSFAAWKAGLESAPLQYPVSQLVGGVVVEGAGVSAFRLPGESLSLVEGALFNRYVVANVVPNKADPGRRDKVLEEAGSRLASQAGGGPQPVPVGEPELVLVPDGVAASPGGEPVTALRYAWRTLMALPDDPRSWMVWADAATGGLLRVAPQWHAAVTETKGLQWRRDPGLCKPGGCTQVAEFKVDPLTNGNLALRLEGIFLQVVSDRADSVEAAADQGFNARPFNLYNKAVCASDDNDAFRQINAYSHVYSLRQIVKSAGLVPGFPERPLKIRLDVRDPDDKDGSAAYYDFNAKQKDAYSSLWLADGQGFVDDGCPGVPGKRLNGAEDVTVMAHEVSHLFIQRLQERRQPGWCGRTGPCPMPDVLGHNILHDLADGLAFAYSSTNCFAGWSAKNLQGVNANLACPQGHTSEGGRFPRAAELPADRFPEHRGIDKGEYANGQIGAAALWEIRSGLRSKALAAGTIEYWVELMNALWRFGFVKNTCSLATQDPKSGRFYYDSCDRDVFLYLRDLEEKMVRRTSEATPGSAVSQVAGKVLGGWAKTGLFLTPFACLDADPATVDPRACPRGARSAAEAVVEIDDRDPGDDRLVDGIRRPEVDYLKRSGPPPRFLVWTGPAYRFSKDGIAVTTDPLCGVRYQVEVAADPNFQKTLWSSGPGDVPRGKCEAQMDLPAAAWESLRAGSKLYYRARTWDSLGNERISTSPGAGAFVVAPPFAEITDSGMP